MIFFPKEKALEDMKYSSLIETVLGLKGGDVHEEAPKAGPNINYQDAKGNTALNWAAYLGKPDSITSLLNCGAKIEIPEAHGYSPLYSAIMSLNLDCVNLLLEAGALVDNTNADGRNAIHVLAQLGVPEGKKELFREILDLLLLRGLNMESRTFNGCTPLAHAVYRYRIINSAFLIAKGADINSQDDYGSSNVALAVYWNSHGCLRLLLSQGAHCLQADNAGFSVLHEAARWSDVETIQILAQYAENLAGLQVDQKDIYGRTPLDVAEKREDVDSEWISAWGEPISAIMEVNKELVEISEEEEVVEEVGTDEDADEAHTETFEDAVEYL
jgi:ankyrin repeat protein